MATLIPTTTSTKALPNVCVCVSVLVSLPFLFQYLFVLFSLSFTVPIFLSLIPHSLPLLVSLPSLFFILSFSWVWFENMDQLSSHKAHEATKTFHRQQVHPR